MERIDEVRGPSAPTAAERPVRNGALPLNLLVVVGKQLGWELDGVLLVLLARGGLDERPDIGEQCHPAGAKQRVQLGRAGMQREAAAVIGFW